MDPLSDVLSLLKPQSYAVGGFQVGDAVAIQWPKHEGIKCYFQRDGGDNTHGIFDALANAAGRR